MKSLHRFLLAALALTSTPAFAVPVAQTLGSNLTAYNGASGAMTNNTWNSMMNARSGGDAAAPLPKADFGNCNALIMRCAQPKCGTGGCTDMSIASTIVAGCVNSNDTCKKHGDELIQYISAQLVASSTSKLQQQQMAAQQAASAAAAQQNSAQMQQMQQQMAQMQADMAEQNAQTVAQLQAALDEQKQIAAEAIAAAAAQPQISVAPAENTPVGNLTVAQQVAASSGVSADVLVREQISGQIMSKVENAQTDLKTLEATMQGVFEYAGCDRNGSNCTGPKRVKAFKYKAMDFFPAYNGVLSEMYDALTTAAAVGVDLSDIFMLLNDACHMWGLYMCPDGISVHYDSATCNVKSGESTGMSQGAIVNGLRCKIGQVIPESAGGCQFIQALSDKDEIMYNWLNPREGDNTNLQVACTSDALDNSPLFQNIKKSPILGIDYLERIIEQDAPEITGTSAYRTNTNAPQPAQYCALTPEGLSYLQRAVTLKKLPKTVCVDSFYIRNNPLNTLLGSGGVTPEIDEKGNVVKEDDKIVYASDPYLDAANTEFLDGATVFGDDGCNGKNSYISPVMALCSTHVYNIGETQNPSSGAGRAVMNDVVALKTTLITQQMKQQYDYLDATIRRLKTQLEKSVLTTALQAAGADEEDGSNGYGYGRGNTNNPNIHLSGAQDCSNMPTTAEVFTCLRNNYSMVYSMSNVGQSLTTEIRKQLAEDCKTLANNTDASKTEVPAYCQDHKQINRDNARDCLNKLNSGIRRAMDDIEDKKNRQNQRF